MKTETAAAAEQTQVIGRPFVNSAFGTKNLPLNYFLDKFSVGVHDYEIYKGRYKSAGYWFDLRPYLKRFVVWQHGNLEDYFAPNKTILRKFVGSGITEIQEIRNPYLGTQNSVSK